jgi:hypothetical protein
MWRKQVTKREDLIVAAARQTRGKDVEAALAVWREGERQAALALERERREHMERVHRMRQLTPR